MRWCAAHDAQHWPASPETVAACLRDRAGSLKVSTLWGTRAAISGTHKLARLRDPCASDIVKATIRELTVAEMERPAGASGFAETPLDAARLEAIRTTALDPRRHGSGQEITDAARGSALVDVALCSMVLESGLRCEQAAALEWLDVTVSDDGEAAVVIATELADTGAVVAISERAFDDLEAVAECGEAGGSVFALSAQRIEGRIRQAVTDAGFEGHLADAWMHHRAGRETSVLRQSTARLYATYWQSFSRWCDERGAAKLPASAETVAAYLRHRKETKSIAMIIADRTAIQNEHCRAGHDNPCATDLVASTLRELRSANPTFVRMALNRGVVEAIRASALEPRARGLGLESFDVARRRGLVDIACCSVMHEANLTVRQAAELRWCDVEEHGEEEARLAIRSLPDAQGRPQVVALAGQAVRDLQAIRGSAEPEHLVFGLGRSALHRRLNLAAQTAGFGK